MLWLLLLWFESDANMYKELGWHILNLVLLMSLRVAYRVLAVCIVLWWFRSKVNIVLVLNFFIYKNS
jgi:hypothetical protein